MKKERSRGRVLLTILASAFVASTSGGSVPALAHAGTQARNTWSILGEAAHAPAFFRPDDIAVDSKGNVYVLDSGNARVVKMSPAGRVMAQWGQGAGTGNTSAAGIGLRPASLSVDRHGDLFIADSDRREILKFASSGRFIGRWPLNERGAVIKQIVVRAETDGNVVVVMAVTARCGLNCGSYYVVQLRSSTGLLRRQWRSANPTSLTDGSEIQHLAAGIDGAGNLYVGITAHALQCYKSCPIFAYLDKRSISGPLRASWKITFAGNLAIGGRGNIFVPSDNRIEKFSSSGRLLAAWTPFAHTPGASLGVTPSFMGAALDVAGNVYVTDSATNRVIKLSPAGAVRAEWGSGGVTSDRLVQPQGLSVDHAGTVWVVDMGNGRVEHVSADGRTLDRWSTPGVGPALALDQRGNVYIGQLLRNQILIGKYSPRGHLMSALGVGSHMAAVPTGLAVDAYGNVFALAMFYFPHMQGDLRTYPADAPHILKLSPSGRVLSYLGPPSGTGLGGLALDGHGDIYAPSTGVPPCRGACGPIESQIERLSPEGTVLSTWGGPGTELGLFASPQGIAVDRRGNVYVVESGSDRIQRLSSMGVRTATWGSSGFRPGQFHNPTGIVVDSHDRLFVSDSGNNRLQRFTP